MGQTLVKNYIHIVFSTKNRKPIIYESIEEELFSYIGGVCNQLDCHVIGVGGYLDHIHILCMLSKKIALMKLVEEIKTHSSKWIKNQGYEYRNFYWQTGYGAFSTKPNEVDIVANYIGNQKAHHTKRTFKQEYKIILDKYQMEYNEEYVWD
jgi:REP element-mobilizing transposase RayT